MSHTSSVSDLSNEPPEAALQLRERIHTLESNPRILFLTHDMIFASLFFGLFTLGYAVIFVLCVHQERELSLPYEKADRMTLFMAALSIMLFCLALYAFINIDWNNLFIARI